MSEPYWRKVVRRVFVSLQKNDETDTAAKDGMIETQEKVETRGIGRGQRRKTLMQGLKTVVNHLKLTDAGHPGRKPNRDHQHEAFPERGVRPRIHLYTKINCLIINIVRQTTWGKLFLHKRDNKVNKVLMLCRDCKAQVKPNPQRFHSVWGRALTTGQAGFGEK
jgi:hypothetical protein